MIKLCFDYGHGGKDFGASYKGRKEKDDVLKVGQAVAKELRRHGVLVDETRKIDVPVSLGARSGFENKGCYDYFISFHRNAYQPEVGEGVETFTYTAQSVKAKSLADKVQKALVGVGFRNRGVKRANFHVLRETKAPAILVEIGFIDSTKDNQLFDTKFDEIVKAIAKAILEEVGLNLKAEEAILYRVIVGSYSIKSNAEKQVATLKASGYDAAIIPYKA